MCWFLILLSFGMVMGSTATGQSLGGPYILSAVEEAKRVVDEAYKYSRKESLARAQSSTASIEDIMRFLRQPARDSRTAVRAADYMHNTLRIISEKASHVHKRSLHATDLLTPEDLATVARLTGCLACVQPPPCFRTPDINKYYTISGICNNLKNTRLGASNTPMARWLPAQYDDGISVPQGWNSTTRHNGFILPLVRVISNQILNTANRDVKNDLEYSHLMTLFGQWIGHDLSITLSTPTIRSFSNGISCPDSCEQTDPCFPIVLPPNDPSFRKNSAGPCLPMSRSAPSCGSGTLGYMFGAADVKEQMNALTAYIDGSQVYGALDSLAIELRNLTNDEGLLNVNDRFTDHGREHLPFNPARFNLCATRKRMTGDNTAEEVPCFLTGDLRSDENIGLAALHALMVREHNRLARALRNLNPHWHNERIYQEARKIMAAYHQIIIFRDYLPLIVGPEIMQKHLSKYPGYKESVDPSISNVFATAAFRFGHLAVQPLLSRLDSNYKEHPQFRSVLLHKAFFAPWRLIFEGGIDPLIRGMIGQPSKLPTQTHMMHDELRQKLFQFSNRVANDLASINLQRGRDHGLPRYNAWRRFCGLSEAQNFRALSIVLKNPKLAQKLIELYRTPSNIDVWLGGVAEPFVKGGRVGPLFACLIAMQFKKLREGDRLWWERPGVFTSTQRESLAKVSLARIVCDNTGITSLPENLFLFSPGVSSHKACKSFPVFNINPWKENVVSKYDDSLHTQDVNVGNMNISHHSSFHVRLGYSSLTLDPVVVFSEAVNDGQKLYSTQTGKFTCQVPGLYQFEFYLTIQNNTGIVELMHNGKLVVRSSSSRHDSYSIASSGAVLHLRKNDQVWLKSSGGNSSLGKGSYFTGHLLYVE